MNKVFLLTFILSCFICEAQQDPGNFSYPIRSKIAWPPKKANDSLSFLSDEYLIPYEFASLGNSNSADLFSDNTTKTLEFSHVEIQRPHTIIVKGHYSINTVSTQPILTITEPDGTKHQLLPSIIGYHTFGYTLYIRNNEIGALNVKLKLLPNQDHIHIEFYLLKDEYESMQRENID